jgi:hypothetical protein
MTQAGAKSMRLRHFRLNPKPSRKRFFDRGRIEKVETGIYRQMRNQPCFTHAACRMSTQRFA